MYGKAAYDFHRRQQDTGESGLNVASFDLADISAEVRMANKKLKFKVLVSHSSGSVATMEEPKDVTENMARFGCRDCAAECCCQNETNQDNSQKHA